MRYIIKFSGKPTSSSFYQPYYQGMSAIGPMFGGTKEKAMRFETKEEAIRETTRHWGFTTTEIEEVES